MGDRNDRNGQHVPENRAGAFTGVDLIQHSFGVDTIANLKAIPARVRDNGMIAAVAANNSHWRFDADATAVDATDNFIVSPDAGTGKWVRADAVVHMKLAVAFGNADADDLFTVPAGMTLQLEEVFWEVTTSWTGGTSSAIGISSDTAPHETQGDLLGGAVGSVAAEITDAIGFTSEPRGASFTAAPFTPVLAAGSTIRYDEITSAFTAGAGFVHVVARQIQS